MNRIIGKLFKKLFGEKGISKGTNVRVWREGTLKEIWDKRLGKLILPVIMFERKERL